MVKKSLFGLAMVAMLSLTACGQEQKQVEEMGTPAVEANNTVEEVPAASAAELTAEEIRFFNEEFFTSETEYPGRWVRNNILYTEFENPAQVDIEAMLYVEDSEGKISAEERAYLKEQGAMDLDTSKFTTSDINEMMQTYLGISLEESEKKGLERFFYYANEDAYYLVRSDALVVFVQVENGMKNEDGTVTLMYRKSEESLEGMMKAEIEKLPQYQMVLKKTADGYQFLSNQIVTE